MKYSSLKNELHAFASDSSANTLCKDKEQNRFLKEICLVPARIAEQHPDWSALRVKGETAKWIGENFRPVLFRHLPFYFEAGINGGWYISPMKIGMEETFYPPLLEKHVPMQSLGFYARVANNYIGCAGPFVDAFHHIPPFSKILQGGFHGVWKELRNAKKQCKTQEEHDFIDAAIAGVEAIHAIQLKFADKAKSILRMRSLGKEEKRNMQLIADAAAHCPWEPPRTFHEGLNTLMFLREIMALVDGLYTYSIGHPDAMLAELYQKDIAEGRLSKDEAYDFISRYLIAYDCHYNGMKKVEARSDHEMEAPLTIGGCNSQGKEIFNDITQMILKAHRENDLVYPKLHCRVSKNSPKEYLHAIAEDVYAGRCVYSLFNDEINIESLLRQGKNLSEARRYVCAGCWDACVDSVENMDTANYFNLAKILESMIYQDAPENVFFNFGRLEDCSSFEEIRNLVYHTILSFMRSVMEEFASYGGLYSKTNPHPLLSSCLEGCLKSLKDESAGGAKYNGRVIVLASLANLVDSLCAIQTLCFEKKTCTVGQLLNAVRHNWEDAELLRRQVLKCPCWGDDSEASVELARFFLDGFLRDTADLRNERGGPYLFSIWIYREYRYWGETMHALPDGRHDGDDLSQALNPSHFRSNGEITTTLNCLSRLDYTRFLSTNINITFDKKQMTPMLLDAVFHTFLSKKLQLLQPNCFSKDDLLNAQKHPENYKHLIVKVCGFSARFVALEKAWQDLIIARRMF